MKGFDNTTQTLKLSEIKIMEQPRKDFSRVDEIAASIQKVGLLLPLLVRPENEGYVLIDGEQRCRALKKLKIDEAAVTVLVAPAGEDANQFYKEAQLMANLMRSDLTLIERMRGFAALLQNAPAKYNALVIANKFGLKEKQVANLVRLAGKLDPAVDAELGSGHYDEDEFDVLAKIPQEFQKRVVSAAEKRNHHIEAGIRTHAIELHFDDIFTLEKAKSAGKIHYESYGDRYTFDAAFGKQVVKEFEARTKKKHDEELEKQKNQNSKQRELTVEQKKKKTEKEKAEKMKVLVALRDAMTGVAEKKATEKEVRRILEDQLRKLTSESLRIMLRAFALEFKASNCSADDMRKLAFKKVFADVKTPEQLVSVITVIDAAGYGIDAKSWARNIEKAIA